MSPTIHLCCGELRIEVRPVNGFRFVGHHAAYLDGRPLALPVDLSDGCNTAEKYAKWALAWFLSVDLAGADAGAHPCVWSVPGALGAALQNASAEHQADVWRLGEFDADGIPIVTRA